VWARTTSQSPGLSQVAARAEAWDEKVLRSPRVDQPQHVASGRLTHLAGMAVEVLSKLWGRAAYIFWVPVPF
jgi:hypothetical protein